MPPLGSHELDDLLLLLLGYRLGGRLWGRYRDPGVLEGRKGVVDDPRTFAQGVAAMVVVKGVELALRMVIVVLMAVVGLGLFQGC